MSIENAIKNGLEEGLKGVIETIEKYKRESIHYGSYWESLKQYSVERSDYELLMLMVRIEKEVNKQINLKEA